MAAIGSLIITADSIAPELAIMFSGGARLVGIVIGTGIATIGGTGIVAVG